MFELNMEVKTKCGYFDNPYYAYGKIAEIVSVDDGCVLYKIDWNEGGYDYLYDFELEVA